VYSSDDRELHDTQGKRIDNSLGYTCKKTARETQAIALKCNKITFHPQVSLLSDEEMGDIYADTDFDVEEGDDFVDKETGKVTYTQETRPQILKWQPSPWTIPNRQELEAIECFLPGPSPKPKFSSTGCEFVEKLHFSTTAVAIDFLSRLSPKQRFSLRELHIQESQASINQPYRHSHGLITFCWDNLLLRITPKVDIWQTDFIPNSDPERYIPHKAWWSIFRWIHEVKRLRTNGMPEGSFSLVIHGPSADVSQNLVDMVIKVAAWQDANAEHFRRQQAKFDPYDNGVISGFLEIVKEVLQGTTLQQLSLCGSFNNSRLTFVSSFVKSLLRKTIRQ
jgi:hypothetical protein